VFQLCFNLNRIHDSVGEALRAANQGRVTANSHLLSSSFGGLKAGLHLQLSLRFLVRFFSNAYERVDE
jgi:hypothetical protein